MTFSYAATDGTLTASSTATLDITPVNDAPVTTPVTLAAIAEDSGARLITQAELLADATDVDGPREPRSRAGDPVWSAARWSTTATAPGATRRRSTTTLGDVQLRGHRRHAAASSTATLDITPVNDAPVTTPVTLAAIAEDSGARLITQAELLAGVTDIDSANLSITALAIQSGQRHAGQ